MSSPRSIENTRKHMWQLIKADIVYNKAVFIAFYGFIIAAAVLNAIFGELEEHISRLMLVSVGLLGIIFGSEEIKTKKIRLSVLLPIPIRQNGILRLPVISMYWAGLMVIIWISSLISQQGNLNLFYLWFILVKTALILAIVSCMSIGQDAPFCFVRRVPGDVLRLLAKLCAVGAAFLYFFSTPFEDWPPVLTGFLSKIFISPTGALGMLIFSSGVVALSVFVFERRKAYTE